MRLRKSVLVIPLLLLSGCIVDEPEYRAAVKQSGDSVEIWIASAHTNIIWLRSIVATLCTKTGTTCDPPAAPPSPPPDGDWGAGS